MLLRFQAKVAGTDIGPRAVEAGINNGRSGTRGDGGLVATELEDHFLTCCHVIQFLYLAFSALLS
jgi:hypothetical protein